MAIQNNSCIYPVFIRFTNLPQSLLELLDIINVEIEYLVSGEGICWSADVGIWDPVRSTMS